MRYDLVRPCASCPFRREGIEGAEKQPVRLGTQRVREVAGTAGWQGAEFQCHETWYNAPELDQGDEEDDQAFARRCSSYKGAQHCAGALIFGLKNGGPHQMGRITGRLGMWDPDKLEAHSDLVFDDLDEFLATSLDRAVRSLRRRRKARAK